MVRRSLAACLKIVMNIEGSKCLLCLVMSYWMLKQSQHCVCISLEVSAAALQSEGKGERGRGGGVCFLAWLYLRPRRLLKLEAEADDLETMSL